jgi:L-alanine-DL-glutamate epimerase-like enolase superfamily enzyme
MSAVGPDGQAIEATQTQGDGAGAEPGALWARLAELPLEIQRVELEALSADFSAEFERRTTVVHLLGHGQEGVGEDVVYDPELHTLEPLRAGSGDGGGDADAAHPLTGRFTLDSFSRRLASLDLFGGKTPGQDAYRRYRTWAYESAALDLALRQAGTSLHAALGRPAQALRFVVSLRLGEPASLEPLRRRLAIAPQLRFKLDPTPSWDERLVAQLVALDVVDSVDLKGCYEGTIVDNPADPELYRRVAEAFPDAWIEDPKLTPETEAVLRAHLDRVTWDAPIHEIADVRALASKPRCINVKPSRIGRVQDLLALYEHCAANGIACYGGGQSELGPGRGQIQYLASMFHPDTSNDVAPSGWNLPSPPADLPGSPLPPAPAPTGFRWGV